MTQEKKKIVFVINNFAIGGTERVILDIISRVQNNTEVYVLSMFGSGPQMEEFINNSVNVYCVSPLKSKSVWFLFLPIFFAKVVYYLIKIRPNTVVSSLFLADIVGMLAAWMINVKVRIIIQHDVHKLGIFRTFLKRNIAIKCSSKMVAVSETVSMFLQTEWKIEKGNIKVIHNGVDIDKYKLQEKYNETLVIGFIGRLETIKGLQYLLQALVIRDIKSKVIVAGDGSQKIYLEKYAEDNNIKNIEFVGSVKDVTNIFERVDIVVVPSQEEGFGLVALEALMSGRVVIVSDIPALRELTDLVFKSQDPQDLSVILETLLSNKEVLQRYKEEAVEWREHNYYKYDVRNMVEKYKIVFNLL